MLFGFIAAALISFALTAAVKKIALRYDVVDMPGEARKVHQNPTPLMGGVAIFLAFTLAMTGAAWWSSQVVGAISWKMILGVLIGGAIIIVGGIADDLWRLPAKYQIIFPLLACALVPLFGIEVAKVTNPFGGFIDLKHWAILGLPLSSLIVFPWLLVMSYSTKLMDGLDGLVSGLAMIGSVMIAVFSLTTKYYQPDVAFIAAIVAGAFLGFLFWNFQPAKIFLGEGGSLFAGFILGVLAVISGGKIAIALLVLGIAVVDVGWVFVRRLFWERKNPFTTSDRKHLHHRLLDAGLSKRTTVIVIWSVAAVFGVATLVLQSFGKLIALGVLVLVTVVIGLVSARRFRPE